MTPTDLRDRLHALDGQSYGAYRQLKGPYSFPSFTLWVDRVQADPFAAPSQLRLKLPQATAQLPADCSATRSREVALRDFLTRQFQSAIARHAQYTLGQRGSGKSGVVAIASAGQAILERSAVVLSGGGVEVRFTVGLPAQGRRILGRQAAQLLCEVVPQLAAQLEYGSLDAKALEQHLNTAEDADWLRRQLAARGLVAFVADGAVLPRQSGVSDRPLTGGLPFSAPPTLRVSFERPHYGPITGMGLPRGISLIVGGGYHGKSTLLKAIAQGVYNHVPGDGREWVVTDAGAVSVRAEDGRPVAKVDISPFINGLPQSGLSQGNQNHQPTTAFSTDNASGSTSQAASIIEALAVGATALLLDEDTCATNFMIRDRRMQALIAKDNEPITPFVDRVEALYKVHGVSTVMVMGGSGDYFEAATVVVGMTAFAPEDLTQRAKAIAQEYGTARLQDADGDFGPVRPRRLELAGRLSRGDRRVKVKVRDLNQLSLNRDLIDLRAAQLVDEAQTRAIGYAILHFEQLSEGRPGESLDAQLTQLMDLLNRQGLDAIIPSAAACPDGGLAGFRRFELAAALNRMRSAGGQWSSGIGG